jgi:hypothetical protein
MSRPALWVLPIVLLLSAPVLAEAPASAAKPDPKAKADPDAVRTFEYEITMVVAAGNAAPERIGTMTERKTARPDGKSEYAVDTRINLQRGPAEVRMVSAAAFVEDKDGKVLSFKTRTEMSGAMTQVKTAEAVIDGDTVHLTFGLGDEPQKKTFPRPKGSVSQRELERKLLEDGLKVGETVSAMVFPIPDDPENAHRTTMTVEAKETLKFDGRDVEVWRVKTVMELLGAEIVSRVWVDSAGDAYRTDIEFPGMNWSIRRVK